MNVIHTNDCAEFSRRIAEVLSQVTYVAPFQRCWLGNNDLGNELMELFDSGNL